jgi:hypothetical protein
MMFPMLALEDHRIESGAIAPVETSAPAAAPPALGGQGGKQNDPALMTSLFGQYADPAHLDPQKLEELRDRQAAAKELAGNFEVVPPGYRGPRRPNQVTAEEFEKIAGTYSDIRRGKTDLKIDDDFLPERADRPLTDEVRDREEKEKQARRDDVMKDIGKMMATGSGRELIYKLADNESDKELGSDGKPVHRTTTIMASRGAAQDGDIACNGDYDEVRRSNTSGTDASVAFNLGHGDDKDLYRTLVQAAHVTTGTYLEDRTAEARGKGTWDRYGIHAEDAAARGILGMGSKLNGKTITENEYRREQRANDPDNARRYAALPAPKRME